MSDAVTIFVSIASYRDPDCKNTVRDLFAKAICPQNLRIGVCLQVVPGDDDDCLLGPQQFNELIRVEQVHAAQSQGACWARHQVQKLYQGEDYYLQIDSHMRFVPGWDQRLLEMHAICEQQSALGKALISTYPLSFTPPDNLAEDGLVTIYPKAFNEEGILSQRSTLSSLEHAPAKPKPNFLIGAGLIFTRGEVVAEVPYDPYLYFEGEEISLAVRFWTHGYDIFTPNQVLAYHDYGKRPERSRHWKDQTDWGALNQRSLQRIAWMLKGKPVSKTEYLQDIDRYGLGKARSLAQYEAFAKLDFAAHLSDGQLLLAAELASDSESQENQRRAMFASIWVNNAWRCNETRSGNGSSLGETVSLRKWLPETLNFLDCKILADIGCGDLNWMQEMTPQLRFYFGYDIVPGLIADLRQRFHMRSNCFFNEWDLVLQTPPAADAILCRDVLTHLPLDAVMHALVRFRHSGAHYLLATTHVNGRNRWVPNGSWYALDLCAPPFNLPAPRMVLKEGGSKHIGVWACQDLPASFSLKSTQ